MEVSVTRDRYGLTVSLDDLVIGLDNSRTHYNLLSHAHSDHIIGTNYNRITIASNETAKIYEKKKGRKIHGFQPISIDQPITLENAQITALNAGHVLGSLQFLIEYKNMRILYTGDLNTENSLILSGGKPTNCDILIIDSTYGHPRFVFPNRKILYSQLIEFVFKAFAEKKIPLIKAYSLGKAQEAIALLQHLKVPIISGNKIIEKINEVHRDVGIKLESMSLASARESLFYSDEFIIVVSELPNFLKSLHARFNKQIHDLIVKKIKKITLTGWALLKRQGIPLSGHSDFNNTLKFIKRADPEQIFTFTSYGKHLSRFLKTELGYEAYSL